MAKNKNGGKRPNSGRKPATDPKKAVVCYIENSKIEKHGGMEKVKETIKTIIS